MPRKTLKKRVSLAGIGLHTGKRCEIVFSPCQEPSGITFLRTDIKGASPIPAKLDMVDSTIRGTNIGRGENKVFTVEHVLSACSGLGIDDLQITLDGPEPPAVDGSSLPYVKLFLSAKISSKENQQSEKMEISRAVEYEDDKVSYKAYPSQVLSFRYLFLHTHPLVSRQESAFIFSQDEFISQIAPARTFGFEEEIEQLKQAGLAKGGSLDNAIVISKDKFLTSEEGLRFENELARHKLNDLIGDLKLLGCNLKNMTIDVKCGGHKHNVLFAKRLLENAVVTTY
jgi:UDP-3-O-[3-hydroxymyristoyl] N-acetylglucosamine deacetylase